MDRRDFLSGALAAGAGSTLFSPAGCATRFSQIPREVITDAEADEILGRLSNALPAARDARLISELVRHERPEVRNLSDDHFALSDELASKALTGLVIGGTFGQMPAGKAANERVVDQLLALSPTLDDAVISGTALLAQMPVRQKAELDDIFRRQPDIPMRLGEFLDERAGDASVAPGVRRKFRHIVSELTARARTQRFSTVCEEYLDKMRRVAAYHGDQVAFAREITEHASVASLYARTSQLGSTGAQASDSEAPPQRPPPPLTYSRPRPTTYSAPPALAPRPGSRAGRGVLIASGVCAGVGVASFALLAAIGAAASTSSFVLIGGTVGAILLVVSLILLLIGGIMYAAG